MPHVKWQKRELLLVVSSTISEHVIAISALSELNMWFTVNHSSQSHAQLKFPLFHEFLLPVEAGFSPWVSNAKSSEGEMRSSKVSRGPYYDVDATMAVPQPY